MDTNKLTGYPSIDKPWLKYYSVEAINAPLPECTIYEYLWKNNKDHLDDVALIYFGRKITYGELFEYIEKAAGLFYEQMGVRENDRILYLLPNLPETAFLLYAGSRIGAVSDYIDPRPDSPDPNVNGKKIMQIIDEEHINHIVALDRCYLGMIKPIEKELFERGISKILIVSAADSMNGKAKRNFLAETFFKNGFKAGFRKLKEQKNVTEQLSQAKAKSPLEILYYGQAEERATKQFVDSKYQKNKLAVIVHTSGTSSPQPKPIPLTNDNLNACVHQTFNANMNMKRGDKSLHILPYFAAFGISNVAHAGLCSGHCMIQVSEFSPDTLSYLVKKYKPQILLGTPTWLVTLFNDAALKNADLSCFSMLTYGGDLMAETDEKRINEFLKQHQSRIVLTKGHGMSETCGCASYATGEYNCPGGIGIPMPNTIYAVVNPESKEMLSFDNDKDYIEGELIISSPAVTGGVLDDKVVVLSAEYDKTRYIFTRDIARMYRDGRMEFLTRSDRSFTRFDGYKIKPYEIESVICQNPHVKLCVVSPYHETRVNGIMPICFLTTEEVYQSRAEKKDFVKNLVNTHFIQNPQVSARQIPIKFIFCDALPVTKNGKLNYRALKEKKMDGNEINVRIEETNISLGEIVID